MDISQRLKTVAQQVAFRTMADIGTDHGYVPIWLVQNNKVDSCIACDINSGPLKRAEENINKNNLANIIQTRLGSGLAPLKPKEVESIVIAGMGGMLTVEILKNGSEVLASAKQLVLAPHLDVYEVRKHLHSIGFKIENEVMIFEDGKYYTIISALKGHEKYAREIDYFFGKINIDKGCLVLKKYLNHKMSKAEEIKDKLVQSNTENSLAKAKFAEREISLYKEALEQYEV